MTMLLALGLAAALGPAIPTIEHRTRIEHSGGAVEATYTTSVSIRHRQVGSVGKPGTPSTLACAWHADIHVERKAVHGSGASLSRKIARDGVVEGQRAGWCGGGHEAIVAQVARRGDIIRDQAIALAREDEAELLAELARLDGNQQG